MKRSIVALASLSLVMSLFMVDNTRGQSIWTQRSDQIQIKLEYLKPMFESQIATDYSINIFTLSARVPVMESLTAVVEASILSESSPLGTTVSTKSEGGNPLFGIEIGDVASMFYGELGFRPSGRKEFSGIGAIFGDFDRAEAYVSDMTTYYAAINFSSATRNGVVYQVRLGPTVRSQRGNLSSTLVDYGMKLGYDDNALSILTALTGRMDPAAKSGKSAYHFLGLDLGYWIFTVRPALFVRLPLDKEYSNNLKQTIGVSAIVEF